MKAMVSRAPASPPSCSRAARAASLPAAKPSPSPTAATPTPGRPVGDQHQAGRAAVAGDPAVVLEHAGGRRSAPEGHAAQQLRHAGHEALRVVLRRREQDGQRRRALEPGLRPLDQLGGRRLRIGGRRAASANCAHEIASWVTLEGDLSGTGQPSRLTDLAEDRRAEQRGLVLEDVLEVAGPAAPGFEHSADPRPAAGDPDPAADGHELGDFPEVPAEVRRVAADEAEQQVLTRGLERQAAEAGREPLEGVPAAAEVRHVLGELGFAGIRVRIPEELVEHAWDVLGVELVVAQLAAGDPTEPVQRLAAGIEDEEGEPATGDDVAPDVEGGRGDRTVGADVGDVARPADDVDVAGLRQASRQRGEHRVVAPAEHRAVGEAGRAHRRPRAAADRRARGSA